VKAVLFVESRFFLPRFFLGRSVTEQEEEYELKELGEVGCCEIK
jgi:hypothetical protein